METFKRLIGYSHPYWWRVIISLVASFGVAGTDGAIAYLVEPVLKKIFTEHDTKIFILLPIGIIVIFILRGFCRFAQEYYVRTAGQLAIQDVRNEIYSRNMGLSLRFFNANPTGVLMSRILNDVNLMQEGVSNVITGLLKDSFGALGLLGVVFYRNWQLALISFIVIPLTVYPAQRIGKKIKNQSKKSQGEMGNISSILQETFSGVKVIKAFSLERREVEKFRLSNLEFYRHFKKAIRYAAISPPITEFITSLGIAAVIWFGGNQVLQGKMTSGEFFSFIAAMVMLYGPIRKLSNSYNVVQQAVAAAERVFEMMDQPREIVDPPHPVEVGRVQGEVAFSHVSFRYDDAEEPVLSDVSVSAARGEIVALVGPSGGGKSTLASLLMRFYDVTDGEITVDGIDVRRFRTADLLRQIALVDQETTLFNDSIANNIRYGNPDATDTEVDEAARAAFARDFIMEMPEGYQTTIGDRGVRLSGGQRQRLCIARAILKNSPILILDEATSALDTESEQMVQKALNNLMANRTTFVIAHRLSTILHANRIVVLEGGKIRESGTHEQLLTLNGLYKKLYEMQFQA